MIYTRAEYDRALDRPPYTRGTIAWSTNLRKLYFLRTDNTPVRIGGYLPNKVGNMWVAFFRAPDKLQVTVF